MQDRPDPSVLSLKQMIADHAFDTVSAQEISCDRIADIATDLGCAAEDLAFLRTDPDNGEDIAVPVFRDILIAAE